MENFASNFKFKEAFFGALPWWNRGKDSTLPMKETHVRSLVRELGSKEVKWKSLSRVQLFATPWTIQSMEFPRP